jgi:hypothetical protein
MADLPEWLLRALCRSGLAQRFGLELPPKEYEFWLGPVEVPPSPHGERIDKAGLPLPPLVSVPLQHGFKKRMGLTSVKFEVYGRPTRDAPDLGPADSELFGKLLIEDLRKFPVDDHQHRVHLHHVNVWVNRPVGYQYRSADGREVFAGAGHDLQTGKAFPPHPGQSPREYHYLVDPSDAWHYELDVRNIHVELADVDDPHDPVDQAITQDDPWLVAVRMVVTADSCKRFEPQDRLLPFSMPVSQGPAWGTTLDVTGSHGQPLPPPTNFQIRRQDYPMSKMTHPTSGVEFTQPFKVPFAGEIVGLLAHLHNGAAYCQLKDASGIIASWTVDHSPPKHPIHVEGCDPDVWPAQPVHVATNDELTVVVGYSTNTTTRDSERVAGHPLDGTAYDYNNTFEMADAMAIISAAINPP